MYYYSRMHRGGLLRRVFFGLLAVFVAISLVGMIAGVVGFAFHLLALALKVALVVAVAGFVWRRVARR